MNEMNVLTLNGEQYEIADKKARTVTDNAGALFAPAIPVTMTGTAVSTDMVSPIEHEVECRVESKNVLESQPGTFVKTVNVSCDLNAGVFTVSGIVKSDAPNPSVYPISDGVFLSRIPLSITSGGKFSATFTLDAKIEYLAFTSSFNIPQSTGKSSTWTDVIVNRGSTATPYTPYIPDLSAVTVTRDRPDGADSQTYTVNSDGSVNGPVKSLSPDMRMSVDNPAATVTVTYNADTKRYIDHKFSELQALALDLKGGM